jgi:Farnesoic acid 0-methyl transferase
VSVDRDIGNILRFFSAMNYYSIPGVYKYNRAALKVSTRNHIVINVRIWSDINVALTRDPDNYTANTAYEIIIGGWTNTQSVIR